MLSVSFIGLTWFIALVFPKIDKVISIMGGLCASTLDYLIPTYCYVKLSSEPWYYPKNLFVIVFFGILVTIGYGSVIVTIIGSGTAKS
mmetsp:Transcript_5608/g.9659  ORF Transcript_5608/g.9659 Transcript_5608/m.9659 type:complete len:88 (-) Transcript_5608:101-364(-)